MSYDLQSSVQRAYGKKPLNEHKLSTRKRKTRRAHRVVIKWLASKGNYVTHYCKTHALKKEYKRLKDM